MTFMNELIRKGFYLGLGAAFASKEKAEKYVKDLVIKGEIPSSEGKRIIDELTEKGQGKQETWNKQFREEIASSLKQLGFVTEDDTQDLKGQLNALEEKIEAMERKSQEEN